MQRSLADGRPLTLLVAAFRPAHLHAQHHQVKICAELWHVPARMHMCICNSSRDPTLEHKGIGMRSCQLHLDASVACDIGIRFRRRRRCRQ